MVSTKDSDHRPSSRRLGCVAGITAATALWACSADRGTTDVAIDGGRAEADSGSSSLPASSSSTASGSSAGTHSGPSTGNGAPDASAPDASVSADAAASRDAASDAPRGPDAAPDASGGADSGPASNPALLADCTGSSPVVCTLPVANGNYDVTVSLGSAAAAATTRVQAETWRIELQPVATAAGAFFSSTFTVNVRAEQHGTYSAPGGILNLLFDGAAPALHGLAVNAVSDPTVFVAGDSTVCDWDPSASNAITPPTPSIERGWAQELSQFLTPGIAVANYAVSGQTAGSFYSAYFPAARTAMKSGDYLFVQFGHNDQKTLADIANYTPNLTKYLTDARAKGVTPVIFTPVARGTGTDFAGLDQEARDLAAAQNVALVDLTNLAWAYYQTLPDKTVLFVPGQETHFTESGATQVAQLVANALKTSGLGLAKLVR